MNTNFWIPPVLNNPTTMTLILIVVVTFEAFAQVTLVFLLRTHYRPELEE